MGFAGTMRSRAVLPTCLGGAGLAAPIDIAALFPATAVLYLIVIIIFRVSL